MFCEGLSHRVSWSTLALGLSFDFPSMPKNVPNRASRIFFQCASHQYCVEVRGLGSRGDPRSMSCESRRVELYPLKYPGRSGSGSREFNCAKTCSPVIVGATRFLTTSPLMKFFLYFLKGCLGGRNCLCKSKQEYLPPAFNQ